MPAFLRKYHLSRFSFTLLLILSLIQFSKAQTYPVQANLFITPPYSVYLSDYTSTGSTRLNLNVFLADLSRPDLDVRFRLLIEGPGIALQTKQDYVGSRVTLASGIPTQFYGDELQEYFALQNLDVSGISRSQLEQTGALPEGIYRFTLEVLEYNRGVQIANSASSTAWLILNDPPLLNLPLDNEIVKASDPQTVRFQWTPRHKGSPNSSFSTEYSIKIVEIWPDNRNPNDAINTTSPIFGTITTNSYYIYSLADPPLIPGRRYAFQVQAKALAGIDQLDVFKNNGYSVVRSFVFGESCNAPNNIDFESSGNTYINLTWEPQSSNTAFALKFKEDSDDANWFEEFSYLPKVRIDQLKPGTSYQVLVQAMCGTLISDESNPITLSTTNNENEFACGNIDINYDLENPTPIKKLNDDDIIYAGDFSIKLDSISGSSGKFSGTGMASFPFLNFVKTKVHFEDISVNTDYRMFDGVIKTVYDPLSSMMYDANKEVESEDMPLADALANQDSTQVDSLNIQVIQTSAGTPIAVDSVYKNADGEIIIVADGMETVVEPKEGEELKFTDSEGNLITVNSSGEIKTTPAATNTTSAEQTNTNNSDFIFGPLSVTLNEAVEPVEVGENCTYNQVKASIELVLDDVNLNLSKTISLESAIFSYTLNCATKEFVSAQINWQDEQGKDIGSISEFSAKLYNLSLSIDKDGNIEGDIEFYASLGQDKPLSSLVILKAGVSGGFIYSFAKTSTGYEGNFDFGGVEGINIDLVKQNKIIASLNNGSLDEDGVLTGKLRLTQEVDYQSSQFTVKVKKLVFDIRYAIGSDFIIENGAATIILSNIKLLTGEIKVVAEIIDNSVTTIIEGNNLHAFGMDFSELNINLNLDSELNFTSLTGNLTAMHPNFGVALAVSEITIENGGIEVLNFSGEVNYEGVLATIQNASLDKESSSVKLDAFVKIETEGIEVMATVEDFSIDSEGNITWGGFDANFDGIRTFGPITVAISAQTGQTSGKWREKTAKASLSIQLDEASEEKIDIIDAAIEFTKHRNREAYRDIKIIINEANISAPDIGPLVTTLEEIYLEIETDASELTGSTTDAGLAHLSGDSYIKFDIGTSEDLNIGSILYLKSGVSGLVTYNFSGEGLRGSLDFHEVKDLNIEARKGETILASLTNTAIGENGILEGTVSALAGASFTSGSLTVDVNELTFDVVIPFQEDISASQIVSGNGQLEISSIGSIEGSLAIALVMEEDKSFTAQVLNTSEISAFGMALTDFELNADILADLQITEISGHLKANHPEFDAALTVSNFLIEESELQTFNIQGKAAYQGFNLDLEKADYANNTLIIDGKVAINISGSESWMSVQELTIDEKGAVTIKGVDGQLDKAPVFISFSASLDENKFKGTFNGELSGIGLSGKLDIGVQDDTYNYAYLDLTASGNIPLPGTGLKLTKLGGQFGYNYALVYNEAGEDPTGTPQEGNYVIGLTIGVADMANMVEISGNSVVQLGNDKLDLTLNGSISIPKTNSIATGNLNVHYVLPDNTLNGSIALDVNVPPETGSVLNGNFAMDYAMGNEEWSVSSTNISAQLLSEIEFIGSIALAGSSSGESFTGQLSGSSSYEFAYYKEFEIFGSSLITQVAAGFNFSGDIAFDALGATGKVNLMLYANGELGIILFIGEYETLISLNGLSEAELTFDHENAHLAGLLNITVYILGIERNLDIEIDQQI